MRGSNVGQFPFEVLLEILQALERDFEFVWRVKRRGIVDDLHV